MPFPPGIGPPGGTGYPSTPAPTGRVNWESILNGALGIFSAFQNDRSARAQAESQERLIAAQIKLAKLQNRGTFPFSFDSGGGSPGALPLSLPGGANPSMFVGVLVVAGVVAFLVLRRKRR